MRWMHYQFKWNHGIDPEVHWIEFDSQNYDENNPASVRDFIVECGICAQYEELFDAFRGLELGFSDFPDSSWLYEQIDHEQKVIEQTQRKLKALHKLLPHNRLEKISCAKCAKEITQTRFTSKSCPEGRLYTDEGTAVNHKQLFHAGYGSQHDLHSFSIPWTPGFYCYTCLDRAADLGEASKIGHVHLSSGQFIPTDNNNNPFSANPSCV